MDFFALKQSCYCIMTNEMLITFHLTNSGNYNEKGIGIDILRAWALIVVFKVIATIGCNLLDNYKFFYVKS